MSAIEIHQDHEFDENGVGGPLPVWWCRGHEVEREDFLTAVFEFCLDNCIDVPAIPFDAAVSRVWQHNVAVGDGVRYDRTSEKPTKPRSPFFPITVFDCYSRTAGDRRCNVRGCKEPWHVTKPIRVISSVEDSDDFWSVEVTLCAAHLKRFGDNASHRTLIVPVGATLQLPVEQGAPT